MFLPNIVFFLLLANAVLIGPNERLVEFLTHVKGIIVDETSQKISEAQIKKNGEFAEKAISIVDIREILKQSLGDTWSKIGKEKQKKIEGILRRLVVLNAFPRVSQFLSEYPYKIMTPEIENGKVLIRKIVTIKGDDESPEDTEMLVDYFFYKKDGQWFITNFSVDGISTVETFSNQFANIIQNKGFDELMSLMERKKEGLSEEYGTIIPE